MYNVYIKPILKHYLILLEHSHSFADQHVPANIPPHHFILCLFSYTTFHLPDLVITHSDLHLLSLWNPRLLLFF